MKIRNIAVILILVLMLLTISTMSFAGKIDPDKYKPEDIKSYEVKHIVDLGSKISGAITVVGTIISVVVTIGIGIKYMVASVEEKAEYKKTMIPVLIGMVFLFGISWIIKLIFVIVTGLEV